MKTKLTMNIGRLFLGTLVFSATNLALATTDDCKTEAKEAAKLIQGFNKDGGDFSLISATLVEYDDTHDKLYTYEINYINPETGDMKSFSDTLVMELHVQGVSDSTCTLNNFSKGGP